MTPLAGILGDTSGKQSLTAQTEESLARIGRTLKAAGFDWSDVVDGLVYLPDMGQFQDMNAAYRETFAKDFPARATVGAAPDGRRRAGRDHVHGGETMTFEIADCRLQIDEDSGQ